MRNLFLVTFLILAALSVIAQVTKPSRTFEGRTRIIWTTDDNPARQEQIGIFDKMFPKLKLTIDPSNNDMSKIIVQTMAGIGPDVIDCYTPMQVHTYNQAGILQDITGWAKEAGTTPESTWPTVVPSMVIDGKQLGYPTNPAPWAIFYNKDIFDKCHLPYPKGDWTWDEFVATAKRLTIMGPDGRRNETYGCMGYDLVEAIWQNGGSYYSEDGTRCTLDSPEAIEAAQWLIDLQFKHKCAPSPSEEESMAAAGGWGQGIITLFSAQRLGMIRYGRWGLIVWRQDPKLRIGVCPLPYKKVHATTVATRISVLNKKSPYVREAFDFIKFLASREYGNQINDSADNCSPLKSMLYEDRYLRNPEHPEEDYNQVFRDEMKHGRIQQISKFVNPFVADRILQRYVDLMRNQSMEPPDAMKACAKEINESMQEFLAERPALKAKWEKLTEEKAELASAK